MSTTTSLALQSLLLNASAPDGLVPCCPRVTGLAGSARRLPRPRRPIAQKGMPVLFVVADRPGIDDAVDDTRFFLQALEGLTDADVERVVLPFPSLQVDPVSWPGAAFRATSARAQALHARRRRAGACGRGFGGGADAAAEPASRGARALDDDSRPGRTFRRSCWSRCWPTAASSGRTPSTSTASSASAAAFSTSFPPARRCRCGSSSSATPSSRSDDSTRRPSVRSIRSTSCCRSGPRLCARRPPPPPPDPASIDRLPAGTSAADRRRPSQTTCGRRSERTSTKCGRRSRSGRRHGRRGAAASRDTAPSLGRRSRRASRATALEELSLDEPQRDGLQVAYQPPQEFKGRIPDWVADVRQALRGRHGPVRRRVARAAPSARSNSSATTTCGPLGRAAERPAGRRGARRRSASSRAASGCLAPALTVYAAADVFEEERARDRDSGKRSATAAFLSDLRDLKVGDLIVHVDHGIGAVRRPQADRRRRGRQRSSSSCAITARTSCSSRSSASI